jgi:hypothetical protein
VVLLAVHKKQVWYRHVSGRNLPSDFDSRFCTATYHMRLRYWGPMPVSQFPGFLLRLSRRHGSRLSSGLLIRITLYFWVWRSSICFGKEMVPGRTIFVEQTEAWHVPSCSLAYVVVEGLVVLVYSRTHFILSWMYRNMIGTRMAWTGLLNSTVNRLSEDKLRVKTIILP